MNSECWKEGGKGRREEEERGSPERAEGLIMVDVS